MSTEAQDILPLEPDATSSAVEEVPPEVIEEGPPPKTIDEIIAETEANAARIREEQAATAARIAEARAALDAANAAALVLIDG